MAFKVGDKVRVRSDLGMDESYGMSEGNFLGYMVTEEMSKYQGQIVTIRSVKPYAYGIEGFDEEWWVDEMFEGLVEDKKVFSKKDLKTGMFGVMSDGQGNFVIIGDNIVYQKGGFDRVGDLNDNLEMSDWKILKVCKDCSSFKQLEFAVDHNTNKVIYDRERDTAKELTIAEIEKALGYSVKIIKE